MQLSGLDLFIWAATFLAHILLLFVLWNRHRAREFPIFTALITLNVAKTIAFYLVLHYLTAKDYFYSYYSMAVVDEILQLLVFYELATHVFCPVGVWARDIWRTFAGMIAASVLVAVLLTWMASPPTRTPIQAVVIRGNFFSATLMSELFVCMLLLSATAGLPWKTHVARIAQGLGAYSIVCVCTGALTTYVGVSKQTETFTGLNHFRVFIYLICASYWTIMLWRDAPAPRELPESMRVQIYALQKQVEYDLIRLRSWRRS